MKFRRCMDFDECVDWMIELWDWIITYSIMNERVEDLMFKRAMQAYQKGYELCKEELI